MLSFQQSTYSLAEDAGPQPTLVVIFKEGGMVSETNLTITASLLPQSSADPGRQAITVLILGTETEWCTLNACTQCFFSPACTCSNNQPGLVTAYMPVSVRKVVCMGRLKTQLSLVHFAGRTLMIPAKSIQKRFNHQTIDQYLVANFIFVLSCRSWLRSCIHCHDIYSATSRPNGARSIHCDRRQYFWRNRNNNFVVEHPVEL